MQVSAELSTCRPGSCDAVPSSAAAVPPSIGGHAGWMAAIRIPLAEAVIVTLCVLLLMSQSRWAQESPVAAVLLMVPGLLLTGVASAGRQWCSLYIADQKSCVPAREGLYSWCRNPRYGFSLPGASGASMATGMLKVPLVPAGLFLIGCRAVIRFPAAAGLCVLLQAAQYSPDIPGWFRFC